MPSTRQSRGGLSASQKQTEAIQDFEAALKIDPKYVKAYTNRALSYLANGKPELALADLEQAYKLAPKDPQIFARRGRIYFSQQKYTAAIKEYTQALTLDPGLTSVWFNRVSAWMMLKNCPKAQADFQQACKRGDKQACKAKCES